MSAPHSTHARTSAGAPRQGVLAAHGDEVVVREVDVVACATRAPGGAAARLPPLLSLQLPQRLRVHEEVAARRASE